MKQIGEGVYFVQGQDEFIPDAHAYVIGKPESQDLSLIDAGLMGKGDYKLAAIRKLGLDLSHIRRVIMTHTHLDHIGCLPEIRRSLPHLEIWMHEEEAVPQERGDEAHLYGLPMFRTMCQAQFGIQPGAFAMEVDRKLAGGETLELGNTPWKVLHIPGHSRGSIGLYNEDEKILIPGDVVYADYAIGRFDLHGADGVQLLDSLTRLAELEVRTLLPGHNRIVQGLPVDYIRNTARQWEPHLR